MEDAVVTFLSSHSQLKDCAMLILTDDNCVIDTEKYGSDDYFMEALFWNGYSYAGKSSYRSNGNVRQFLYPKDNRYYLVEMTADSKVMFAKRLDLDDATRWLLFNNHQNLPEDLKQVANSMR